MLNVSKWIKIPLLLDTEEMRDLFTSLSPFSLYDVQRVTASGEEVIPHALFLEKYAAYIEALKRGEIPPALPAPILSVTEEAVAVLPLEGGRQLCKPKLPVVQMQNHAVRYSEADGSFRSQLFGSDAICWGIQLGYPQIMEDPKTYRIQTTRTLPNGSFFRQIQKWVRQKSRPTPFIVRGARENVPFRLGKACFSWINSHPQLKTQGISVDCPKDPSPLHSK